MSKDPRAGLPSASSYHRVKACKGHGRIVRGLPDVPSPNLQAWAERGDAIHAWLAGKRVKLTEEQRDMAERCKSQCDALLIRVFGDKPYTVFREKRLYIKGRFSGQADLIAVANDASIALVVDYKSGFGDTPESPQNLQLRSLAVLVRLHYGPKCVVVAIVQPSLSNNPMTCEYDEESLIRSHNELLVDLEVYNDPNAPLTPGPQCDLCRGRIICPARQEYAGGVVALAESPGWAITPVNLPMLIPRAKAAAKYAKDILAFAKAVLTGGNTIEGWKLGEGQENREIHDVLGAFSALHNSGLVSKEDFLACVDAPIGAIVDKAYERANPTRKRGGGPSQKEIAAQVSRVIEPFVVRVKKEAPIERTE